MTDDLSWNDYEALPLSIRAVLTYQQYLWLSDAEKARLVQSECEPETYDD